MPRPEQSGSGGEAEHQAHPSPRGCRRGPRGPDWKDDRWTGPPGLILLALTLVSYNKQITGLGFYLIMEVKFQKVISKIIIAYILK